MRTLALALVLIAGCSPTIRSGHYTCMNDSECPAAARYCRGGLCHSTPGSGDSGSDLDGGGEVDAFMPPPVDAFVPAPDGSRPCSTNAQCLLPGALCIENLCRRPCTRGGPACGAGEECVSATANGEHSVVCLQSGVAIDGNYAPCSGTCPAPFECVNGHCLRDCNGPTDGCLSSEQCVPNMMMRRVCVANCPPAPGTCPSDSHCASPPGFANVCIVW